MSSDEAGQADFFGDRLRRARGRSSRNAVASAKVTREEQEELENAARRNGKALSEWAREVLLTEARRSKGDPVFTELVAMRILLNLVLPEIAKDHGISEERFTEIIAEVRQHKHDTARGLLELYARAD